jgi:hypothetical protein
LGTTPSFGGLRCGKLFQGPAAVALHEKSPLKKASWSFFVQNSVRPIFKGLQRITNNLSTEPPTEIVGNVRDSKEQEPIFHVEKLVMITV